MNKLIALAIALIMIGMNLAFIGAFSLSLPAWIALGAVNVGLVLLFIPGRST